MFGLEEYYTGLLAEAKSPEEIKKVLEYQFVQGKGVPQDVLDYVFSVDPTKKKSYTRWVLTQWENSSEEIAKSIKNGNLARMFKYFKSRAAGNTNDEKNQGLDLTNMESFEKAMSYLPEFDPCLDKDGDPNALENQFDISYTSSDGKWIVAQPHTFEANEKLGQGCRWCTAGAFGNGEYYWNSYSPKGPIWVNFDKSHGEIGVTDGKEYPYTRYQFLFEWNNWNGEIMNNDDKRVPDISNIGMPEDVIEFYGTKNPRYEEFIRNGGPKDSRTEWENYIRARENMKVLVIDADSGPALYLLPEKNDQLNLENVPWHLYNQHDFNDPISNVEYDKDNFLVLKSLDAGVVVLADVNGGDYIYFRNVVTWTEHTDDCTFIPIRGLIGWYLLTDPVNENLLIVPSEEDDRVPSKEKLDRLGFSKDESLWSAFLNKQVTSTDAENGLTENYVYIEVTREDGTHSLLYKGLESADLGTVIFSDKPAEGQTAFSATIKDKNTIVTGEWFDHNLSSDGSSELSIVAKTSDDIIVVKYSQSHEYNLYNIKERRVLYPITFDGIESTTVGPKHEKYLICFSRLLSKAFVADPKTGRKLSNTHNEIRYLQYGSPFLLGRGAGARNLIIIYLSNGACREFGPFKRVQLLGNTDRVVVCKQNDMWNILNAQWADFLLDEDADKIEVLTVGGQIGSDRGLVRVTINGETMMYDYLGCDFLTTNGAVREQFENLMKRINNASK